MSMPTGTGNYLDPHLDALIAEALVRYGEHRDVPAAKRDLALDYAYALNNDTWLLETAVGPDGWQPAAESVGG